MADNAPEKVAVDPPGRDQSCGRCLTLFSCALTAIVAGSCVGLISFISLGSSSTADLFPVMVRDIFKPPSKPRSGSAALMVHVLPASELLRQPAKEGTLATDREQFSILFGTQSRLGVYVLSGHGPEEPIDLPPNLDAAGKSAAISSAFSPPPPLPPSPATPPPPPTMPSPSTPVPWWVVESQRPPRPKTSNATLPNGGDDSHVWAYEVLDPRPGTVLLASAAAAAVSPYPKDAVILLIKVCGCRPSIFGVVLSSTASNLTVGRAMCPTARARYHSFVDNLLHLGGPVGPHITLVHDVRLAGDMPLLPGLRVGGCLASAQAQVDAGSLRPADVTFFDGYAAWPIERLVSDIGEGKWTVARASSALLMKGMRAGKLDAATVRAAMRR